MPIIFWISCGGTISRQQHHRLQTFKFIRNSCSGRVSWPWPQRACINRRSDSGAAWGSPRGHEDIVVYGGGFCGYTNVVCIFSGSDSSGSVQGEAFEAVANL